MCRTYGIGIMRTARHPNSVLPQWYVSFAKSWVVKSGNAVPMTFPRVVIVSVRIGSYQRGMTYEIDSALRARTKRRYRS